MNWRKFVIDLAINIVICFVICLLWNYGCNRKEKPVITKKQGKEIIIKQSTTITIDSIKILKEIIANTKPKIIYRYLKPTHDYTEQQPNYVYSPCDSIVIQSDSGTKEGVKYAIRDTLSGNSIIGRSIRLDVPETTITKVIIDSNKILRVDTVYINQKQKFGTNAKCFFRGFAVGGAAGLVGGSFIPR
jgi:hypothetical protein